MTKVKAKKKNLKLKRQIRKTVGALFMVSAIVIAAIPVQGLSAETLKAESAVDNRGSGEYPTKDEFGQYPEKYEEDFDLDFNAGIDLVGTNKEKHTAYSIKQLTDGSYSYNWQFEYYLITVNSNTNAIISKYNDNYPENEVIIGNSANTDYYIVTSEKFNAFFAEDGPNDKDYSVDYYEWEDVVYNGNASANVRWFQKWEKEGYEVFTANCQRYRNYLDEYQKYQDAYAKWLENPVGNRPQEPAVVAEPTPISRNPVRDFNLDMKLQYYCGEAKDFPIGSEGYTLVPVTDNVSGTNTDGTAKIVYMAKGGKPNGIDGFNDENGFLLTSKSVELIGIARRAFYNIHNVNTLTMPEEIKYVGDEAFYMSFIKSITFDNVENIGNRAFLNCGQLAEVKLEKGTVRIGSEAFRNSGITELVLPNSIMVIGGGAFSECHELRKVDMNSITSECAIGCYAFYNDYALNEVSMDKSNIRLIGEGAFAISNTQTGSWSNVVLPEQMTGAKGSTLGNYLFQGRNNLRSVKFPINYGVNGPVTLPSGMFKNCPNMEYVDFTAAAGSTICGNVGFNDEYNNGEFNSLFLDVLNPDFYVRGPELNVNGQEASPRQSTWKAITKVSNFVPYVYVNRQGVECYEVSDGVYLLQANEKKELTNCRPIDESITTPIDLIIPDKVGAYAIESIANGAMSNSNLRSRIRSITIQDDSLTKLDNGVFEGLPNLEEVTIGNSVNSIGDRAFANCKKLIDVTFHTPKIGYEGFTIGTDAFKTNSNELTIHGDIVPGYAPFEFAMGKDSGKIDDRGKRICYKSQSPDLLTVMYDNKTDNVTLLDYPKYNEIDERNGDYCRAMEASYYEKYGGNQGSWVTTVDSSDPDNPVTTTTYIPGGYDSDREAFTRVYLAYMNDPDTNEDPYDSVYYGPWIDDTYLALLDEGCFLPENVNLPDKLPAKYFDKYPYSILENYERGNSAVLEYQTVTDTDLALINTCLNIVVPKGVTSIDATSFFTAPENTMNVSTYFGVDDEGRKSYEMCTRNAGGEEGVVPGLFSGHYEDYDGESPYEEEIKGNDRILSVTMYDVKYLPDYAFDSCERLQFVSLGDACEDIGNAPFRGCDFLTNIKGNDNYVIENMIIYSVNEDEETYTIEECLPSRGVNGSSPVVMSSSDPIIANVSAIKDGAFEDCDHVVKVLLDDAKQLGIIPRDAFNDCDALNEVGLPSTVYRIDSKAFGGNDHIEVTIPGKEVHIVSDAFEHVPTNTINTYKGTSAEDYGNYHKLNVELLGNLYTVRFLDWDATLLKEQEDIVEHQSAVPPEDPKREGYTFTGWLPSNLNDVTSNMVVVAQYSDNSASENRHTVTFYAYDGATVVATYDVAHEGSVTPPAAPVRKGYDFVAWVPNTYTNVTQDMAITASYQPSTATSGSNGSGNGNGDGNGSPSPSATPSPTPSVTKYTVNVSGGSGSGEYAAGSIVAINAYAMSSGQVFDKWTTSTAGVGFADPNAISTTFTMPAANVTITATYKTGNGSTTAVANGSNTGTTGNSSVTPVSATTNTNTGTTVEVTKPGISSTGLAGATVTGATDNFIVKVSEDQAATNAAVAALQARYGDISRIKYFPMDISLYDSTGRNKITDTTGISVNITLPLPDELREYAGNNRIAHISNNTLEDLGAKFTTIDGVPCINFTASQFSPYVIYVDTANLTQGTIDATPKTGDPIHPKWFLAMGMACISLILFFKKDKAAVKSKTA
ncbi:MAG: leucine-rich repeat protein [Lachnospiraceae bacterium]|nr:leucine-rich repeat protein [Lachnospiraceae bacterium]